MKYLLISIAFINISMCYCQNEQTHYNKEHYFEMGLLFMDLNQYEIAIHNFDTAIYISNDNSIIFCNSSNFNKANCYYELKQYNQAIYMYSKCISFNPKDLSSLKRRAICEGFMNDNLNSVKDYDNAIYLDNSDSILFYNRSIPKNKLGDHYGAIKDCDMAILLSKKYSNAYFARGLYKSEINDKVGSCMDLSKSAEMGYYEAYEWITKICN